MKMGQRALWNRIPFGKFNRASTFPGPSKKRDCGVGEPTAIEWNIFLTFQISL
jgi:hypothetical protein